jgi:hypothetical protein
MSKGPFAKGYDPRRHRLTRAERRRGYRNAMENLSNGALLVYASGCSPPRGRPAVMGSPKQVLKNSLIIDLAVRLDSGRPALPGVCGPPQGALLWSGESGSAGKYTAQLVSPAAMFAGRQHQRPASGARGRYGRQRRVGLGEFGRRGSC